MLAWSRAQVDGLAFFGVVAASLLGMLLFLRVDMVIAVAGFVGAAAIGRMAGLPAGRRLLSDARRLARRGRRSTCSA